jgi:hypothetical protein
MGLLSWLVPATKMQGAATSLDLFPTPSLPASALHLKYIVPTQRRGHDHVPTRLRPNSCWNALYY